MIRLLTGTALIAGLLMISACQGNYTQLPSQEHEDNNTFIGAPGDFAP